MTPDAQERRAICSRLAEVYNVADLLRCIDNEQLFAIYEEAVALGVFGDEDEEEDA